MTGITHPGPVPAPDPLCEPLEDRHRRDRRVRARRRAPAAPRPRRHRLRGRRPDRRARQHRRRRRSTAGTTRSTPASSSTTSATTRASSRCSRDLGVATQPTEMSFGVSDAGTGLEYRGTNLNTLFAQRRNLAPPVVPPPAHRDRPLQPRGARRWSPTSPAGTAADRLPRPAPAHDAATRSRSADFVRRGTGSRTTFVQQFLVPFGASIWSADPATFTRVPGARLRAVHAQPRPARARGPAAVAHDHRRLPHATSTRSSRRSPTASASSSPVQKIVAARRAPTRRTRSSPDRARPGVVRPGRRRRAQRPGAAPARRPHARRARVLGAIGYQRNTATLHTDPSLLPDEPARAGELELRRRRPAAASATVTYWMNRLQSIDCPPPAARHAEPARRDRRRATCSPSSSTTTRSSTPPRCAAQRRRHEIQGARGICFAGAYWGYGFHEDGVQSGLEVVARDRGRPMTALATVTPLDRRAGAGRADRQPRSTRAPCPPAPRPDPRQFTPRLFLALPRRRRAARVARPAPAVVGPPPGAGPLPAPRLPRRRRRSRSATRCATWSSERLGRRPRAGSPCSRTSAPSAGCSTRSPSTTAGPPTATASTPSCSR